VRKYARIFVRGHYLFREANSFPRAKLEENCELGGTDNVCRQMSKHVFAARLRLLCLLSIGFKNWGISWDIPQFWLGNIRPCDTFRPITGERKYLIDYNSCYYDCPFGYGLDDRMTQCFGFAFNTSTNTCNRVFNKLVEIGYHLGYLNSGLFSDKNKTV